VYAKGAVAGAYVREEFAVFKNGYGGLTVEQNPRVWDHAVAFIPLVE
jgi:hypothetical protein